MISNRRRVALGGALLVLTITAAGLAVVAWRSPDRRTFSVRGSEVVLTVPKGFEVVESEREVLFRKGLAMVVVADLGPCNTEPGAGLPFDHWVRSALINLGVTGQFEVAKEETVVVDGCEVRVVDTWDRLTHEQRRRFAMTQHDGRLLAIFTRPGSGPEAAGALDDMLAGLSFRPTGD